MSIVAYIVVAVAFGLTAMLADRRCAAVHPIRLSRGLLAAAIQAALFAVAFLLGGLIGDLIRFEDRDAAGLFGQQNSYIYLGMTLIVALRMIAPYLKREPLLPVFDISDWGGAIALAGAGAVNVLLVGIGVGFADAVPTHWHRAVWPMVLGVWLLGYLGIMFGRSKVEMRERRWMGMACLLLLGAAIAAVIGAR